MQTKLTDAVVREIGVKLNELLTEKAGRPCGFMLWVMDGDVTFSLAADGGNERVRTMISVFQTFMEETGRMAKN